MTIPRVLNQRRLAGARHLAEYADTERDALAQGFGGSPRFRLDFNVLGDAIEDADADVIETKVFLNFGDDLRQHLLRRFAGDGRLGDIVEKSELARTSLLLGE